MKLDFSKDELLDVVQSGYGVIIKKLQQIYTGAQSANFIAQKENGEKFIIKVVHSIDDARRIVLNSRCVEPVNGVVCLFRGKILKLGGNSVLCLSYCEGKEVRFEEYDFERIDVLVNAYREISKCMQKAENPRPYRDNAALERSLREEISCFKNQKAYLSALEGIDYSKEKCSKEGMCVIHGDFHFENFRYKGAKISGIFDFMEFRIGYQTEDLVRLVLCSAERMRWYHLFGRGRIFKMFARLVSETGYPYEQWVSAIDGYLLRKLRKYASKERSGVLFSLKIRVRLRLYRKLKEIARSGERATA